MANLSSCKLENRGVLAISGPDSRSFLQGLITNDIEKVTETNAIYAAFLTPQGKYMFDFFISQDGDALLIDCERERLADFMKRLRIYKLRADVNVVDRSNDLSVLACWGDDVANAAGLSNEPGSARALGEGTVYVDPRLNHAGLRAVAPTTSSSIEGLKAGAVGQQAYDVHRLSLGLPQSNEDLIVEKSILLESGLDELNSIDWEKGCYMGQEVTARSKYRGLVKKRLMPVKIEGPVPAAGSIIMAGDKQAGEMRSGSGALGIALMRLSYLEEHTAFSVAEAPSTTLTPFKPDWANF
jgi:folate-binding protein YgfZ